MAKPRKGPQIKATLKKNPLCSNQSIQQRSFAVPSKTSHSRSMQTALTMSSKRIQDSTPAIEDASSKSFVAGGKIGVNTTNEITLVMQAGNNLDKLRQQILNVQGTGNAAGARYQKEQGSFRKSLETGQGQLIAGEKYQNEALQEFKIDDMRNRQISELEITDEVLEFYIDFLIKNEILFTDTLEELKGKFDWPRFQNFTQSVSHGSAPFSILATDETVKIWLINKLSNMWDSKLTELQNQAYYLTNTSEKQNEFQKIVTADDVINNSIVLKNSEIASKFDKFKEIIKFYFSLFDSVVNPYYMDRSFSDVQPGKNFDGVKFVNLFYQMAEETSENAAPFLKYRMDPEMASYIKYLRTN